MSHYPKQCKACGNSDCPRALPRWLSDNLRRILDNQDAGWGERTLATMLQAHEQYGEPSALHFWQRQVAPLSDR